MCGVWTFDLYKYFVWVYLYETKHQAIKLKHQLNQFVFKTMYNNITRKKVRLGTSQKCYVLVYKTSTLLQRGGFRLLLFLRWAQLTVLGICVAML